MGFADRRITTRRTNNTTSVGDPLVILEHVSLLCPLASREMRWDISLLRVQGVTKVTLSSLSNTCFDVSQWVMADSRITDVVSRSQGSPNNITSQSSGVV